MGVPLAQQNAASADMDADCSRAIEVYITSGAPPRNNGNRECMFRMRRCRWRLTLIATAVATWIGMAQAHQMIYDQDGYKLAVGIEGGLGGFAVGNVDTGPATSIRMRRCKDRSRPPSGAPRGIGSKALSSRFPNWKRRFSILATPTRSSASSAR